ncbi:class I SAM-dependent methyltransferase [Vineibacter terrae]|uniref:class I SAM-dependent methyltransferase n=1 Tax=Vineibacter terrae TaxID=2586908 RepID=UPI002E30475C|nr:class I SAM-dependent methyltransferase [Vineibacter terrae]HEX2888498.1 class I SAM-dependent methyltransferase [Vineibacter terrae]
MKRPIADAGIEMVCDTHRSQLIAIGFDFDRLRHMSVLECGGTGRDALAWQRLGAGQVTHVDLAPDNVARIKAYCDQQNIRNLRSMVGDILAIDLPAQGFDIVRSRGVWHHLADPALGLARYARWCKVSGYIHVNAYRGGVFFYYGNKLFRQLASHVDMALIVRVMREMGTPEGRIGCLLDDFYVPFMHTADQSIVEADFAAAGLTVLWPPARAWKAVDHDIRYPDMPEKTEHIQYWLRKDKHHDDAAGLAARLAYHQGVDDIALARQLPEAQCSLAAFERLVPLARAAAQTEKLAVVLARLYLAFHFDVSVMAMSADERHRRFAALLDEAAAGLRNDG